MNTNTGVGSALSPQESLLTQIRDVLAQELIVHRQLLGLSDDKRRAVIAADGRALSDVVIRESGPLAESTRLRALRERLMRSACALWNLPLHGVTMSLIAAKAGEALRADLMRTVHDLRGIIERLRDANERNQLLIRQGLAVVRELVGTLTGAPLISGYDRRGLSPYAGGGSGALLDLRG